MRKSREHLRIEDLKRAVGPAVPDCPAQPDLPSGFQPYAFTLIELLVVIGIIAVLIGLLIPVAIRVQEAAKAASTQALISNLQAACERYYNDFKAYPGPIPNADIRNIAPSPGVSGIFPTDESAGGYVYDSTLFTTGGKITGSENLVLGLCGGLFYDTAALRITYRASNIGTGPASLNPSNPKTYSPYVDATDLTPTFLSGTAKTGHFSDGGGEADDSIIPEFVDRFSSPMPILYLRCRVSVTPIPASSETPANNSVITDSTGARIGSYDISQIIGYTGAFNGAWSAAAPRASDTAYPPAAGAASIGEGKSFDTYWIPLATTPLGKSELGPGVFPFHGLRSVNPTRTLGSGGEAAGTVFIPYDAYPYFKAPDFAGTPRAKDSYVLISAGKDRVYGTADDICSFGSVAP